MESVKSDLNNIRVRLIKQTTFVYKPIAKNFSTPMEFSELSFEDKIAIRDTLYEDRK